MTKEVETMLKEKSLSYILENIKKGESQRIIDNINESIIQVDKRINLEENTLSQIGIAFANSFNGIRQGVINIDESIAAAKDSEVKTNYLNYLNLIKSILKEVLEVAKQKDSDTDADVIFKTLAKKISEVNETKG